MFLLREILNNNKTPRSSDLPAQFTGFLLCPCLASGYSNRFLSYGIITDLPCPYMLPGGRDHTSFKAVSLEPRTALSGILLGSRPSSFKGERSIRIISTELVHLLLVLTEMMVTWQGSFLFDGVKVLYNRSCKVLYNCPCKRFYNITLRDMIPSVSIRSQSGKWKAQQEFQIEGAWYRKLITHVLESWASK